MTRSLPVLLLQLYILFISGSSFRMILSHQSSRYVPSRALRKAIRCKCTTSPAIRNIIEQRVSTKYFDTTRNVSDSVLADILRLTQRAPTSFNLQPYACVLVREKDDRDRLSSAMLASNADKVKSAPVIAVFAADLEPSKRVPLIQESMANTESPAYIAQLAHYVKLFAHEGQTMQKILASVISPLKAYPTPVPTIAWSYKQTAFAAATFLYAAQVHNLATCGMEGYDEVRVRNLLNIPDRYSVPVIVCLGYPKLKESKAECSSRLSPTEVFFDGKFGLPSHRIFTDLDKDSSE
uniref:Nitroreductase family putative n=1 Tax=Albugo laibachii Nc14 TaxID=890382 RepID=F0WM66_9STRA|nr:nitroreductase family putative [Albugo laibachii Nc14]|eukprot:CCA22394.1 nitroreductase family putative [Albugo laibachii Nc14]